jgi:hypothetical protein
MKVAPQSFNLVAGSRAVTVLAAAHEELRAVPLGAQISRTRREAKEEERKLDSLRGESRGMAKEVGSLQGTVSKLSRLGTVLKRRKALIPCKICGGEGVLIDVPSRPVAVNAVSAGLVWNAPCARCGRWAQYSAWDISAGVGWLALPES